MVSTGIIIFTLISLGILYALLNTTQEHKNADEIIQKDYFTEVSSPQMLPNGVTLEKWTIEDLVAR